MIHELNQLSAVEYPEDDQVACPDQGVRAGLPDARVGARGRRPRPGESPETLSLHGIDQEATAIYGRRLLAARRLAERGVRFTPGLSPATTASGIRTPKLKDLHAQSCASVDRPIAGLLKGPEAAG